MRPYILVYNIDDFPDNGGGIQHETFDNIGDLDKRVEQVMKEGNEIYAVGKLERFTYKAIEVIIKVVRE